MIILVGASASGKTEIAKKLISQYDFQKVVTYTTRPKRIGEKNGIDYHFISEKSFLEKKEKNFFLETTIYNGNYYGTPYDEIGLNKVLIVDPNGLKAFRDLNDKTIVTFYIIVSEEKRIERMKFRGDTNESIAKRIENDRKNFAYENIGNVDFVIEGENSSIVELTEEIFSKYASKVQL